MVITEGIHQLKIPIPNNPLGHLNCYLIEGDQGWFMIDTGWYTTESFQALQDSLGGIGLSLNDINTIIVTHVHLDHFGLAGRIKKSSPQIQIMAHYLESNLLETRYIKHQMFMEKMSASLKSHGTPVRKMPDLEMVFRPAFESIVITPIDNHLYGGEIISTGIYDLEVIWTPGHSPGHLCLYEAKNRLLFSGDHVLPAISSNVIYGGEVGDNPLYNYICSLNKLKHLPVKAVLPAHQDIFQDLSGRIRQLVEHHEKRKDEIVGVMETEFKHAYEISSQISWDLIGSWDDIPPLHKGIAILETVAHLECMRWEGRVTRIMNGDSILYQKRQ